MLHILKQYKSQYLWFIRSDFSKIEGPNITPKLRKKALAPDITPKKREKIIHINKFLNENNQEKIDSLKEE